MLINFVTFTIDLAILAYFSIVIHKLHAYNVASYYDRTGVQHLENVIALFFAILGALRLF